MLEVPSVEHSAVCFEVHFNHFGMVHPLSASVLDNLQQYFSAVVHLLAFVFVEFLISVKVF